MRPCERSPDVRRRAAMPVGHSFLIFRKVQSPKGIGFIKWETTFFTREDKARTCESPELVFLGMTACQLYPGRLVIEIFFRS